MTTPLPHCPLLPICLPFPSRQSGIILLPHQCQFILSKIKTSRCLPMSEIFKIVSWLFAMNIWNNTVLNKSFVFIPKANNMVSLKTQVFTPFPYSNFHPFEPSYHLTDLMGAFCLNPRKYQGMLVIYHHSLS